MTVLLLLYNLHHLVSLSQDRNTPRYQVTEWIISEFEIEGMEYCNSRHGICIGFQP